MYSDNDFIEIVDEDSNEVYVYEFSIEERGDIMYIDLRQLILKGMDLS